VERFLRLTAGAQGLFLRPNIARPAACFSFRNLRLELVELD
jgi:hypothetical protein